MRMAPGQAAQILGVTATVIEHPAHPGEVDAVEQAVLQCPLAAAEQRMGRRILVLLEQRTDPGEAGHRLRQEPEGEMRSEEHTSELQSLMRSSYAVFCLKKKICF